MRRTSDGKKFPAPGRKGPRKYLEKILVQRTKRREKEKRERINKKGDKEWRGSV